MVFDNTLTYIPLFAIFIVTLVVFVLLFFIRKKQTARVSFITFISSGLIVVASLAAAVYSLYHPTSPAVFFLYTSALFVAAFLFIPYVIMLTTFEPQKFQKLVPPSVNEQAAKNLQEAEKAAKTAKALDEQDLTFLDISQNFMIHASDAFSSESGMNDLLDYINKTIRDDIKADGGAIMMVDDFDDVITVKSFDGDFPPPYKLPSDMPHKPVRVATNFKFASFPLSDNLFGEIAKSGKPELITRPEMDDRIYQNGPEEFLECGSYIIVPMKLQDTVIGITAFARRHGNDVFTEDNLKTAITLTDFAAAAIKNVISVKDIIEHSEISKEADIASRIQEMLKPTKLPTIHGLQLGSYWNPSDGVCGDYYDIIMSRKDRISFVMSDIAGKGINSIIIMTMLRAMIRLVVNTTQSAGKILSWVNRGIAGESFSTDHFGSCALINYNPVEKTIELATGGTTPVYHYSVANDSFTKLSSSSEPIGVEKTTEYEDCIQKVETGDIIITYTDGLVEALNAKGQQYTTESLLRIIQNNHNSSSKDIANLVKADIKNFSGNTVQHDDQSLLVVKIQ